ncbi:signal peptidase II [Synergistaceae bacterium OttesenSCG-928-I11]|nr:signal peptidase II [Synergistaceae bacterium OttesenSCG-928-I11]
MNKRVAGIALFLAAFTIDRVTKLWALSTLPQASPTSPLFSLGLRFNRGISFSLFEGSAVAGWLAPLAGLAILAFLTFRYERLRGATAVALLWAGTLGNVTDRLLYGHVIDWFRIVLYVNMADAFLCLGALLLLVSLLRSGGRGDRA